MNIALRKGILAGIALICLGSITTSAQQAREVFGKNRMQYRQFNWQYLSGENFDIYYYDARRNIATDALQFLEAEFDRITDLIGYPPYFKTKVFLYNSLSDLRQSNVGLNQNVSSSDSRSPPASRARAMSSPMASPSIRAAVRCAPEARRRASRSGWRYWCNW